MSKESPTHLVAVFSRDLSPVSFPYLAAAPMMALLRDHRVPTPDDLIPDNPYLCVPWYLTDKTMDPESDALEHPIPADDKWFAPADARRMAKALLTVLESTWTDEMLVRVIAAGLTDEALKIVELMDEAEQRGIRFHFKYEPCGELPADLVEWETHWLDDIQDVMANRIRDEVSEAVGSV